MERKTHFKLTPLINYTETGAIVRNSLRDFFFFLL